MIIDRIITHHTILHNTYIASISQNQPHKPNKLTIKHKCSVMFLSFYSYACDTKKTHAKEDREDIK